MEDDYDYSVGGARDPVTGHWSDKGKRPNHPTFSEESIYSTPQTPGGRWADSNANGLTNTFVPSQQMYDDQQRMKYLVEYLRGPAENGKVLMVPPTIAAPRK